MKASGGTVLKAHEARPCLCSPNVSLTRSLRQARSLSSWGTVVHVYDARPCFCFRNVSSDAVTQRGRDVKPPDARFFKEKRHGSASVFQMFSATRSLREARFHQHTVHVHCGISGRLPNVSADSFTVYQNVSAVPFFRRGTTVQI